MIPGALSTLDNTGRDGPYKSGPKLLVKRRVVDDRLSKHPKGYSWVYTDGCTKPAEEIFIIVVIG